MAFKIAKSISKHWKTKRTFQLMSNSENMVDGELADIRLGNLSIWVHARQFPDSNEYWDGNWLVATAKCFAKGAQVQISGAFLTVPELIAWAEASELLYNRVSETAVLKCMEHELEVELKASKTGKIGMTVTLIPDFSQRHSFKFEIDQSYLPEFLKGCRNVIKKFPVVGAVQPIN